MTPEEQKQYLRKWRRKHPGYNREYMRKWRGGSGRVLKRKEDTRLEESRPRRTTPDIVKFRKMYGKYPTENELQQYQANKACKVKGWGL